MTIWAFNKSFFYGDPVEEVKDLISAKCFPAAFVNAIHLLDKSIEYGGFLFGC